MEKRVTIDTIAKDLGISKTTVSRAISGKGRIGKDTVAKVQAYIAEHNYHPSAIAKSLAYSRTSNIAFVMNDDKENNDSVFFQKCMWGVQNYAASNGYDVMLCSVSKDNYESLERLLRDGKIDGVVIGRVFDEEPAIKLLKKNKIPFVTIGSMSDETVNQVDNDHAEGCREFTESLLNKGVRRPALFGGNSSYIMNRNRLSGYLKALRGHRIDPDQSMIFRNLRSEKSIEEAIASAMERKPDCLICMDDIICTAVLKILARKGISVPEDVRVASYYDGPFMRDHYPAVTALSVDVEELGKTACEELIRSISGNEMTGRRTLGYVICQRESA